MSDAKIKACSCPHTAQDKMYGAGMRVHNWAPKENKSAGGWRCTVCKTVKGGEAPR
jgi:hypothetical protein